MAGVIARWHKCHQRDISLICPPNAYLPYYIKNPSLFSGTYNNPGNLATDVMKYSMRVSTTNFGQKRVTRILPVKQRVLVPLSNPIV